MVAECRSGRLARGFLTGGWPMEAAGPSGGRSTVHHDLEHATGVPETAAAARGSGR
jgi:hypothetical protein